MTDLESNIRATLDDLAMRRRLVSNVIRDVAAFYRLDPREWLEDATVTTHAVGETTPAAGATEPPSRETKGARRATRPTQAPAGDPEILAALKAAGEPVSPRELAQVLKTSVSALRSRLKPLERSKQVIVSGKTMNRRIRLVA